MREYWLIIVVIVTWQLILW